MVVAFDAVSTAAGTAVSSLSWTHSPVGTPTGVGVGVAFRNSGALPTITGITYDGQAMTLAQDQTGGANTRSAIYGLANPPAGAKTVVVTLSGSVDRGVKAFAVTVTGGDTSTVFSNSAKNTLTQQHSTITVNSATDEFVMDIVSVSGVTFTGDGEGQTLRVSGGISSGDMRGSTKAGADTSVTMTHTSTASATWGACAASFKAAAAGGLSIPVAMHQYRRQRAAA